MNQPSDPSGAARAPQDVLDEVREALAEYKRALLYWDDLPGKCTEDEAHAISTHIKKHAPEWLGALVQAVEDQQRRAEHEHSNAVAALRKYEEATREADRLSAEVAQLRADGQRLREALHEIVTDAEIPGECDHCGAEVCRNVAHDPDCLIGQAKALLLPPGDAP